MDKPFTPPGTRRLPTLAAALLLGIIGACGLFLTAPAGSLPSGLIITAAGDALRYTWRMAVYSIEAGPKAAWSATQIMPILNGLSTSLLIVAAMLALIASIARFRR